MKARILGLMTTGTILSMATGASAQTTTTAPTEQVMQAQAAMIEVVSPSAATTMGRDLLRDPDPKRAGPGVEQPEFALHVDKATGKQYLITVYMASADRELHPKHAHMTLRCASYEFQEKSAPVKVTDVEIQAEEGRRTAHHPEMPPVADDKGRLIVLYGNDYMQDSPSTYAKVIDYKCNVLSSPKRVSVDYMFDDANSGGAGRLMPYVTPSGQTRYIGNYLATNGKVDIQAKGAEMADDDIFYSINLGINDANEVDLTWPDTPDTQMLNYTETDNNTTPPTVTQKTLPAKTSPRPLSTMTDIGRGKNMIAQIDNNRFAWCTPYGNDRPSDHIECGVARMQDGEVLSRSYLLKGNGDMMGYRHWNQSSLVKFGANQLALHACVGDGGGKNTDMKGTTVCETHVLDVVGDALSINSKLRGAAVHQPHSSICAGKRGVDGQEEDQIFIVSQPHTGIGRSAGTFLHFLAGEKKLSFDERKDKVPTGWFADGQLLSNMYGENPMQQGRNYTTCLADVPNPAYQKEGGWMKDVKTFFVTGINGRQPGYSRNAYWMSLVPAVTKYKIGAFANPAPADQAVSPQSTDPTTPAPAPAKEASSGCGCSTPGSTNANNFAGGLLLLGLAIGGIAARRRS